MLRGLLDRQVHCCKPTSLWSCYIHTVDRQAAKLEFHRHSREGEYMENCLIPRHYEGELDENKRR